MRFISVFFIAQYLMFLSLPLQANQSLSQLKLADRALLNCIQKQAIEKKWEMLNDVNILKCHGMGISSIEGLQALTQLTSLSLHKNKLQHANVKKLTQLEYLNIANNRLKTINISGLNKLQTLYLFKNKLKTIDFSGLLKLKKVRITSNKLEYIDISPLISLEKAYFFDNQLTDLMVTGLPHLTFMELKQNPMPDEVYDRYDAISGITIIHDGNAEDWQ